MPARHKSRQRALQVLFLWDSRRPPVEEAIDSFFETLSDEEKQGQRGKGKDPFLEELVRGVTQNIEEIDRRIVAHAEHWRLERMPAVDRTILRLAVYELIHTSLAAVVVIDEALELARRFAGEESVHFINGVLDAIRKDLVTREPAERHKSEGG